MEDGTDIILIPVTNFGEIQLAQLAKSTLLSSTLSLGSFRSIKVCSDAKESGVQKEQEATAPIQTLVKLQALVPEFVVEDLPWAELQPRFQRLQ